MQLRYGLLADFATPGVNGKHVVVGIWDTIVHTQGADAPIVAPRFFIVAAFDAHALDGTEHELEIRLVKEDGAPVLEEPVKMPVRFRAMGPDRPMRADMMFEVGGITLPSIGTYEFQFWMSGKYVDGIELTVVQPPRSQG